RRRHLRAPAGTAADPAATPGPRPPDRRSELADSDGHGLPLQLLDRARRLLLAARTVDLDAGVHGRGGRRDPARERAGPSRLHGRLLPGDPDGLRLRRPDPGPADPAAAAQP